MDAQELQRLRELAQPQQDEQQKAINDMLVYGTGFTVGGKHVPTETVMMFSNPEVTRTTPAAPVDERAVSPAESVQSIDTGEFWNYVIAYVKGSGTEGIDLVKYIDGLLVKDHNRGYVVGHAEGRRSAMEELAKEGDRADRAEKQLAAIRKGICDLPIWEPFGQETYYAADIQALLAQPLQQEGGK